MKCPECGSLEPFNINVRAWAEMTDDGNEEVTDIDWEDGDHCHCATCGHRAPVGDFKKPKTEEPPLGLGKVHEAPLDDRRYDEACHILENHDFQPWEFEDDDGWEHWSSGKDCERNRTWTKTVFLRDPDADEDADTVSFRFTVVFQENSTDVESVDVTRK
jgi:hypothetical protein